MVGREPHEFTIVKKGKEDGEETVLVYPERKGRAVAVSRGEGGFEILFRDIDANEAQREKALAEMKGALPEGAKITSRFDEKERTFKVTVEGPKGEKDSLGLMKKLVKIGEDALK